MTKQRKNKSDLEVFDCKMIDDLDVTKTIGKGAQSEALDITHDQMSFREELCHFIQDYPTPYQFVQVATILLLDSGYPKLKLRDE